MQISLKWPSWEWNLLQNFRFGGQLVTKYEIYKKLHVRQYESIYILRKNLCQQTLLHTHVELTKIFRKILTDTLVHT